MTRDGAATALKGISMQARDVHKMHQHASQSMQADAAYMLKGHRYAGASGTLVKLVLRALGTSSS